MYTRRRGAAAESHDENIPIFYIDLGQLQENKNLSAKFPVNLELKETAARDFVSG